MTTVMRWLGPDEARWAAFGSESFWTGASVAVGSSVILAWNRFGGLVIDGARPFVRLTLIGVYGWLGLALLIWLLGGRPRGAFLSICGAVGYAHRPLLVLGVVVFVIGGLFQLLGPGLVVAAFAFAFWFPACLVRATTTTLELANRRGLLIVSVPYAVWLITVGRLVLERVGHLL